MHKQELGRLLSNVPRGVSEKTLVSVSSAIFEAIDSPRSLAAKILLENGEFAQLVNLEIDPSSYANCQRFADDYLATKLLSKYPDFRHADLDPEKAAMSSFREYEEMCRATNRKFRELDEDPSKWDPFFKGVLSLAKRKISFVLGTPDLNDIAHAFGWGPGATTAATGSYTSAYVKYASRLDVTSNSLVMGWCCVNSIPAWVNCQLQTDEFPSVDARLLPSAFNIVRGNEIVFVPKNAKTHRAIAKEPHVNSYLQKGLGSVIRRKLRIRAGIDLKDQSQNQRLAREGSLSGELATIDLSGASDTVSYELVKFLLPERWFSLLSRARSGQGFIRKENTWIHYQKFSSMGNSCTFELESLIFWALLKSVLEIYGGEQTLSVYGDDLIIPVSHYENVAKVIQFVGFKVNERKSFHSGPFRESCGADYFNGINVRPIFFKEAISNVEGLFKVANSIRRYSHSRNFNYGCDIRFHRAWQHVVNRIPPALRGCLIPEGAGDSGLLVNLDEACPPSAGTLKRYLGWEGWLYKAVIRLPVKRVMRDVHAGYTATLAATGKAPGTRPNNLKTSIRDLLNLGLALSEAKKMCLVDTESALPLLGHHDLRKMTYPKVTRIHTHGWYDLGPWF